MTDYIFNVENITVTADDYRKAFTHKALRSWKPKAFFILLFICVFFILQHNDNHAITVLHFIIAFVGAVAVAFIMFGIDALAILWMARKVTKNELFETSISISSAEDGFEVRSERGASILKWSDYKSFHEAKDAFILELKSGIFMIFTKYEFDENSLDNFKKVLQDNIK